MGWFDYDIDFIIMINLIINNFVYIFIDYKMGFGIKDLIICCFF